MASSWGPHTPSLSSSEPDPRRVAGMVAKRRWAEVVGRRPGTSGFAHRGQRDSKDQLLQLVSMLATFSLSGHESAASLCTPLRT